MLHFTDLSKERNAQEYCDRLRLMQKIQAGFRAGMFSKHISSVTIYNSGGPGSFIIRLRTTGEKAKDSEWMRQYHQNLLHEMVRSYKEHLTHKPALKFEEDSASTLYAHISFEKDLHSLDDNIKDAGVVVLNEKYLPASVINDNESDRAIMADAIRQYLAGLSKLQSLV